MTNLEYNKLIECLKHKTIDVEYSLEDSYINGRKVCDYYNITQKLTEECDDYDVIIVLNGEYRSLEDVDFRLITKITILNDSSEEVELTETQYENIKFILFNNITNYNEI